jgi:ribosomal-protein-alanine N-acetyltransferase
MYERYGFAEIGRRKGYYPAANQGKREDAIVMRLAL